MTDSGKVGLFVAGGVVGAIAATLAVYALDTTGHISASRPGTDPITIRQGRAYVDTGVTHLPLTIRNNSGEPISILIVQCGAMDASGGPIQSAGATWSDVSPGAERSGQVFYSRLRLRDVARFDCAAEG